MTDVLVTPAAKKDLDALWDVDEDAAAEIETALEEIAADPRLAERLCERKFSNLDRPSFNVDVFQELWHRGLNLYRLKLWDWEGKLLGYRVLYAHQTRPDRFYILAVIPRDHSYDTKHPTVQRVVADYERLGLPSY